MIVPFFDDLRSSQAFQAWLTAVKTNPGWQEADGKKSNAGLIRVFGVCATPAGIVVALEHQALAVSGTPEVVSVQLEFNFGTMMHWQAEQVSLPSNCRAWVYSGDMPKKDYRFQFSCQMSDGSKQWACITSVIGDRCGPIGWQDPRENKYRPWEHRREGDSLRDNGCLVGGVWVDNTKGAEAYRVDVEVSAVEPVLPPTQ